MWQRLRKQEHEFGGVISDVLCLRENSFLAYHSLLPEGRRKRSCPEEGRLLEPGGFECSMRLCLAGGGGGGRDGGRASKASSPAFKERSLSIVELH